MFSLFQKENKNNLYTILKWLLELSWQLCINDLLFLRLSYWRTNVVNRRWNAKICSSKTLSPMHLMALCINTFLIHLFPFVIRLVRTGASRSLTTQWASDNLSEHTSLCVNVKARKRKAFLLLLSMHSIFIFLSFYKVSQFSDFIIL